MDANMGPYMEIIKIVAVLAILTMFAFGLFFAITSEKRSQKRKEEMARSLGFTPVEPDPLLVESVSRLYRNQLDKGESRMSNVFSKTLLDGEMYIFDLHKATREDDNTLEIQAVAVRSHHLHLPHFFLFPKVEINGAGINFTNNILQWMLAKIGNPVEFPEYPEFSRRFLVNSSDPAGTRSFLDDRKADKLAQMHQFGLHAGETMFTISKPIQAGGPKPTQSVQERLRLAEDIFEIFKQ